MLTVVSGYWIIPTNKQTDFLYFEWFKNTLSINCPYVFFYSEEKVYDLVKNVRDKIESPTHYIKMSIQEFYTYKFYDTVQPEPTHCPSKELNLIWNQKLFLMQIAKNLNIFNSEYFIWIDSGLSIYRNNSPPSIEFPNKDKLLLLPKDKFVFTSSDCENFIANVIDNQYYHYISGTFLLHKNFIDEFVEVFKNYLDIYLSKSDWIYTDQVIYTLIYKYRPDLFYKLGHGYGKIVELLY